MWQRRINHFLSLVFSVLFITFSVSGLVSAKTTIDLSQWESGGSTVDKFRFIDDPSHQLTIDDVASLADWQRPQKGVVNRGFSTLPTWISFRLSNPEPVSKKIIVEYVEPSVETIDFYSRLKSGEGTFTHQRFVYTQPTDSRPVSFYRPAFSVDVPPESEVEVYYRLFQGSDFPMHKFDSMRVWEESDFYHSTHVELSLLVILLCVEIAMGLSTLLAYFATKDRLYLYYTAFAFSAASLFAAFSGVWSYLIASQHYELWMVVLQINICQLVAILFVRHFLNVPEHLPRVDKVMLAVVAVVAVGVVLNLFGQPYLSRIIIDFTAIGAFSLIPLGIYAHKKKVPHALLFSGSWVFFAIGMALASARLRGYIADSAFAEWLIYFGGLIEVILLTTVMILRFRHMQREKQRIEDKHWKYLENAAHVLEERVKEQTKQLYEAKALAEKEARTDLLTGLPNRRSFFEGAQQFIERAKRNTSPSVHLLMIDIDHFKKVNDTHSHACGDAVLRHIGNILNHSLRKTDLLSRLGGEEFAVVMENTPEDAAQTMTERLRSAVEETDILFEDQFIHVTISVGMATWHHTQNLDQLLQNADHALYQAKREGRNRIVYAPKESEVPLA
ncbi:GGDEF domain protein [Grimontia indica]|uniref:diguanylate cyclase n=1 Tax=Grimontia indica TaxID=1056512 RepID=R1GWE4_9GAMM|nr:diguanylate cyclase [Grimontia indica]EOD80349.1 GGDEF domain protein [Grimontia indica]